MRGRSFDLLLPPQGLWMNRSCWSLETAAQSAEVVDSEGADQVDGGRSAEPYTETFCYVHCCFTAVALTESNLHAGKR